LDHSAPDSLFLMISQKRHQSLYRPDTRMYYRRVHVAVEVIIPNDGPKETSISVSSGRY
jgi:hypothetical protein